MRILALLVLGLFAVPVTGYTQTGPFNSPWDGRGFIEVGGGGQGGSHLVTDTSRFPIYDEDATIAVSQSYGGGPLFDIGGGVKVWKNLLVGLGYSRYSDKLETAVLARVPNPLFANRPREAELRQNDLKHTESTVHLSAIYMLPVNEAFTVAVSAGPSFASVEHEFARDVRVSETGGAPFDSVAISDLAFVRSSKTKATINIGAKLVYELPFRLGDFGRLGASLGFRYSGGSVDLDGASGPVEVKYGGPQVLGGVRVTF
jgi:hypothetical protein